MKKSSFKQIISEANMWTSWTSKCSMWQCECHHTNQMCKLWIGGYLWSMKQYEKLKFLFAFLKIENIIHQQYGDLRSLDIRGQLDLNLTRHIFVVDVTICEM